MHLRLRSDSVFYVIPTPPPELRLHTVFLAFALSLVFVLGSPAFSIKITFFVTDVLLLQLAIKVSIICVVPTALL